MRSNKAHLNRFYALPKFLIKSNKTRDGNNLKQLPNI